MVYVLARSHGSPGVFYVRKGVLRGPASPRAPFESWKRPATQRLPGRRLLLRATSAINALFTIDYLARWWCRGLRLSYLATPIMIADLLSILPFLLRPWVPAVGELELTFLKLVRVQRIYRFFRPKAFKSFLRILLGTDEAKVVLGSSII